MGGEEGEEEEEEEAYNEDMFQAELEQIQAMQGGGAFVPGMGQDGEAEKAKLSRRQLKRLKRKEKKKIEESVIDLTGPEEPINLDADNDEVMATINKWVDDKHDWVPLMELTKFLKTKYSFNAWKDLC